MTFRERPVTGTVVDADGTPVKDGQVEFRLTQPIGYTSTHVVVDRPFRVTTGDDGIFTATIWCDDDSLKAIDYLVLLPTVDGGSPDPTHAANLSLAYEDGSPKQIGLLMAESTPINSSTPPALVNLIAKNYIDVTAAPYNAIPDSGATENSDRINAAISDANSGSKKRVYFPGNGDFYRCDGPIIETIGTKGVTLFGDGAGVEPTQDVVSSAIVYAGTEAKFIDAQSSRGFTIDGLGIQYSNAAFDGDLLSTNISLTGDVTAILTVLNANFGGRDATALLARSAINTAGLVQGYIARSQFNFVENGIIGQFAGDMQISNAVWITNNYFSRHGAWAIAPSNTLQWVISQNTFEYRRNASDPASGTGVAAAIGTDYGTAHGIVIRDNGFWDPGTAGYWIDIHLEGGAIEGNSFWLDAVATGIMLRNSTGLSLKGNRVYGSAGATWIAVDGAPAYDVSDDGSNLLDGGITKYAVPSLVVPTDSISKTHTVRHLSASGNPASIDATGCAGAGTGPSVNSEARDLGGYLILTPGTSPATSAKIFNVAFAVAYPTAPLAILLSPANAAAAALSGNGQVYVAIADISTTGFAVRVGSTALAAGTAYHWYFQVIGV